MIRTAFTLTRKTQYFRVCQVLSFHRVRQQFLQSAMFSFTFHLFLLILMFSAIPNAAFAQLEVIHVAEFTTMYHPTLRQDVFIKDEYHYLNVSGVGTFTVFDILDCTFECLGNPSCLSINLAASKGANGKLWCELLSSDRFSNPEDYKRNQSSHHFSIKTPCMSSPCQNGGTCVANYKYHTFGCRCKEGFFGEFCEEAMIVVRCVSVTQLGPTSYELNATSSRPANEAFCRVIRMDEINAGDPYVINVDLYNVISRIGVDYGNPGVMYNVVDEDNFDVFCFRLRMYRFYYCYQTGYVLNGTFFWSSGSRCPDGPPRGATWFNVRVEVSSDKSVKIFLDNALVKSQTAHFNTKGRGGVVARDGYQNIIRFRNFRLFTTQ